MKRKAVAYSCAVICFLLGTVLLMQFNLSHNEESVLGGGSHRLLSLPKVNNSMSDLSLILQAMESNIPFGYAHFNDGEMSALFCEEGSHTVFSWNQRCSVRLNVAMQNAFRNTAPNFYVGIPCNCEFRGLYYLVALRYLNITHDLHYSLGDRANSFDGDDGPSNNYDACPAKSATLTLADDRLRDRITVATLFINGNYLRAKKEITRIINKAVTSQKRSVHIVVAYDRLVHRLPFPIKSVKYVAQLDAFEQNYEEFRTKEFLSAAHFMPGDIVLIMAGPVGRILSSEWGLLRADVTFLEMGSFWDTELWNRPKHHLGISRPCMARDDVVGLSCSNLWVHSLPQILPEWLLPLGYLC